MRILAWFSAGFGIACLLSCFTVSGPITALIPAALCVLCLLLWHKTRPRPQESPDASLLPAARRRGFQLSRRGAALCLGAAAAFLWFFVYSQLFYVPAMKLADTEQTISGTVSSYPERTSIGGWSMTVRLDNVAGSPDVLLYGSSGWGGLKPGDHVACSARLKAADRIYGDETTYYTAKGVFLLAYCDTAPDKTPASSLPLRYWPDLCARKLKAAISTVFDGDAAPLAAAVTLGDKSGLDEQLYSSLSRSGVMHAAVVSGMHISFLVSFCLLLCQGRRGAALCLVPLLIFYALMAGGTPSAFRAVIMQCVLLAGPVLGRENDPPTSLGFALLVLLLQNPFAAASVSLQFSFASVAGILLVTRSLTEGLYRPVKARLKGKGRPGKALSRLCYLLAANVSVSLGAMLFTVPLSALYFGRIVLAAPLTGIFVLWAVTVLMICVLFVGTLAVFFPAAMVIPGLLCSLPAHYIRAVVSVIGRWPLASLDGSNLYFRIWLITAYVLIALLALSLHRRRQAVISLLCMAALLALAVGLNRWTVRRADLTVTALNVGQGASTLLLSGDEAILVDCGGSAASSAGDLAADRLASLGRTGLDALVLTHLDKDHFNGVSQLFYRLEVARVFAPDTAANRDKLEELSALAAAEGAELVLVRSECSLSFGRSTLTLYPPLGSGTSNEEGLFALCSCGDFDVLMTGDADAFVERMLIKYDPIPDLELLLVGHHGSAGSTCQELLDTLRPELALISVGYNSYGHPAPEVLDRLSAAGAAVYRTDLSGAVTVTLRDGLVSVTESE